MKPSMFIDIQDHPGESEDDDHTGWIDVFSWGWGMTQGASTHMGGGGGRGQARVNDLTFVKPIDKSTPALVASCFLGKHIPKVQFECTKASGDNKALPYIKMKMEDVLISSCSPSGSGEEDRLFETVTLNFAKVEFIYTVQTKEGGAGAQPMLKWNIRAGKGDVA